MSRDASNGWRAEYDHQGVDQPEAGDCCPNCSGPVRREGGCRTCIRCEWGKCS